MSVCTAGNDSVNSAVDLDVCLGSSDSRVTFQREISPFIPGFSRAFCEQPPDWSECMQRHLAEYVRLYKCKKVTKLISLFQTTAE